jgi:hypothetical protein
MKLTELVCTPDGELSLTKLAACTAHLGMAAAFFRSQVLGACAFNSELWLVYAGFAIGHASYDKTLGVVRGLTEQRLDAAKQPAQEGP